MVEVYIHMLTEEAKYATACGIKLSEMKSRDISIKNFSTSCFPAWMHPDDDIERCRDDKYQCVKLLVGERYCFVGDRDIYSTNTTLYNNTIKPFDEYRLGEFRHPEALVACTIVPGRAILQGPRLDTPLLYPNSEELYKEKMFTFLTTEYESFPNDMLYAFFNMLSEQGEAERIDMGENILYIHLKSNRHFTFNRPMANIYGLEKF